MERWFVSDHGPSDEAVGAGIHWLTEKANELGVDHGAILIPTVQGGIGNLERTIGPERAASLKRSREFRHRGIRVQVFAHRDPPPGFYSGPIFVVWASPKGVEIAEESQPPAVCALEWSEGELNDWKRTWGPRDVDTGESLDRQEFPLVIVGALRDLTLNGDVLHPSDKGRAIDTFKLLGLADIPLDPGAIHAEALRQGWAPSAAGRLRVLADKVASGVRVRGGSSGITKARAEQAVEHWKQRAGEDR